MIRRPPRSTLSSSSAASDVYKRQVTKRVMGDHWEDVRDALPSQLEEVGEHAYRIVPRLRRRPPISALAGSGVHSPFRRPARLGDEPAAWKPAFQGVRIDFDLELGFRFMSDAQELALFKLPAWHSHHESVLCLLYTSPSPRDS
eukprot:TRINITY_DN36501_c0_g1_i1.p1 TRINITY_DN36501_c0_g1~~TRINITY_DN36501_c0_g1_i1.p1  ORF type:complete len:144 (+),score=22.48 TRINITY_DN36501_c0_g1_i1:117-548(+)